MNDERLEQALKAQFAERHKVSGVLKVDTIRKAEERRERRMNIALICIQVAYILISLAFLAIMAFIFDFQSIALVGSICYVCVGGLIGAVYLLSSRENREGIINDN